MPDLTIHSYQRVSFAGKTGSGKTFAAHYLLRPIRRLIVIDPKMMLVSDPSWRLEPPSREALKALRDGEYARIGYWQPPAIDNDGFPIWDSIFDLAMDIGDVVVYIDEMYSVAKNGRMSYPMRRAYTQGRALGVGVWAATQRPAFVPTEMMSEAEWNLVFMLKTLKDRKRVAGDIGFDVLEEPIRDVHGFWLLYESWPNPLYFQQLDTKAESIAAKHVAATTPVTQYEAPTEVRGRLISQRKVA